ncbi:MAG: two component transcriptional regulator, AraC family [Paenibacillus sp.]|nr:two component transcriptional regulator, AraC family [Paenibacillus sp.]
MYRLLLIDDEVSTRTGLRDFFDWSSYGIEVVGEAADGVSGLELALSLKPDIVLTDVKMPKMNGIELAKRLREHDEDVKIVFISGYDDVDYLKSALQMDAIDYIFKPIERKEISAVFEKVVKIADFEKQQQDLFHRLNAKLQMSMPLLREKFFLRLLEEGIRNTAELERQIEFLELALPLEAVYCAIAINIDEQEIMLESLSQREVELTSFSIQNICQEIVSRYMQGYVFEYRKGVFAILLCMQDETGKDTLFEMLSDVKMKLDDFLHKLANISVSIGVGTSVQKLGEVSVSYAHAEDALHQKLFLGKNQLILVDQLETPGEWDYRSVRRRVDKLSSLLKAADEAMILDYMDCLFGELSQNRRVTTKFCRTICLDLILVTTQFLLEIDVLNEELESSEEAVREKITKLETIQDMNSEVKSYIQLACRFIAEKKNKKSRNVIERIKSVIESRFSENLTISEISKEVHLTTTYVCLIFKQETGFTLNDYITKIRMERAIELLKNPTNKLHDICYAIGYTEPGYLSKMFKKYTGLSPSEYRNMHGTSEVGG